MTTESTATVWKFVLEDPRTIVDMPADARVISAAEQHGEIVVWAEVDTAAWLGRRVLQVINTGGPRPFGKFVGTVLMPASGIVWHVYDCGEV